MKKKLLQYIYYIIEALIHFHCFPSEILKNRTEFLKALFKLLYIPFFFLFGEGETLLGELGPVSPEEKSDPGGETGPGGESCPGRDFDGPGRGWGKPETPPLTLLILNSSSSSSEEDELFMNCMLSWLFEKAYSSAKE